LRKKKGKKENGLDHAYATLRFTAIAFTLIFENDRTVQRKKELSFIVQLSLVNHHILN